MAQAPEGFTICTTRWMELYNGGKIPEPIGRLSNRTSRARIQGREGASLPSLSKMTRFVILDRARARECLAFVPDDIKEARPNMLFPFNPLAVAKCSVCGRNVQLRNARFPADEKSVKAAIDWAFCLPHGKGLTFSELMRRATIGPADLRVTRHLHEVRGIRSQASA